MTIVYLEHMQFENEYTMRETYVNSIPNFTTGGTRQLVALDDAIYVYHWISTSGTFHVPDGMGGNINVLIVAGGGGGGAGGGTGGDPTHSRGGGGGGAGGYIFLSDYQVDPGDYPCVVGGGGLGATYSYTNKVYTHSTNGADSSFDSNVAIGGGRGACDTHLGDGTDSKAGCAAGDGGSGGGGSCLDFPSGGSGISGQGHDGGTGVEFSGGGGGGGGSDGYTGAQTEPGAGGDQASVLLIPAYTGFWLNEVSHGGGGYHWDKVSHGDGYGRGGTGGAMYGGYNGVVGCVAITYKYLDFINPDPALEIYDEKHLKITSASSVRIHAKQTESLGQTLTRTFDKISYSDAALFNLSGLNHIYIHARSTRTGANVKVGFHDTSGVTHEVTPNITYINTWQVTDFDISAIPDAAKSSINQIIITIVNADEDNDFYLDNIYASSETYTPLGYSWKCLGHNYASSTAIDEIGRVFTWGQNAWGGYSGQGDPVEISGGWLYPELVDISSPTLLDLPGEFVKADSGEDSTIAMNTNGELYGWGIAYYNCSTFGLPSTYNADGMDFGRFFNPIRVAPGYTFKDFCHCFYYTMAVGQDDYLYVWGWSNYGSLGLGEAYDDIEYHDPVKHPILTDKVKFVGCSWFCSAAVTIDDRVYGWGTEWGYGSDGDWPYYSYEPVEIQGLVIPGGETISELSMSYAGIAVRLSNGEVWITGDVALLLEGYPIPYTSTDGVGYFVQVPRLQDKIIKKLFMDSFGDMVFIAIEDNGATIGWIADEVITGSPVSLYRDNEPFQFAVDYPGQRSFTDISINTFNTAGLAITSCGCLMSWGANWWSDHLGLGIHEPLIEFQQCAGLTGVAKDLDGNNAGLNDVCFDVPAIPAKYGKLYSWGVNDYGQLALNNIDLKSTPQIVISTVERFKDIALQGAGMSVIRADGTLWTCGADFWEQLGNGIGDNDSHVLSQIDSDTGWISVNTSYEHTLAIKNDGTLWGYGAGYGYGFGNGSQSDLAVPTQIGTDKWLHVDAGFFTGVGIKADGTLWVWGVNVSGELGTGGWDTKQYPYQIGSDADWKYIQCGEHSTFALKQDGTLWVAGTNSYGELGTGSLSPGYTLTFTQVGTDTDWEKVTCCGYTSLGIKSDGTIWACGANDCGQIGDGTLDDKLTFVQVGSETYSSVSAGWSQSFAIRTDGTLWAWGDNSDNTIGTGGPNTYYNTPVQIGTSNKWSFVDSTDWFTFAIGIIESESGSMPFIFFF